VTSGQVGTPDDVGHDSSVDQLPLFTTPEASKRRIVHCKWAEAADAVYIGRPGPFGNPFRLDDAADDNLRAAVLDRYRAWFTDRIGRDPAFRLQVETLRGRTLSCWCPTRRDPWRACHGDVILDWLDTHPPTDR
jgi:hypothetical protein